MGNLKVQDLMSNDLITLLPDEDLALAEEVMRLGRIRHLPVVDDENHLLGLITHRDILRAQISSLAHLSKARDKQVKRSILASVVMTKVVETVAPDMPAADAGKMLLANRFGCLPVVENDLLVGIITEADFLALAVHALERASQEEEAPPELH